MFIPQKGDKRITESAAKASPRINSLGFRTVDPVQTRGFATAFPRISVEKSTYSDMPSLSEFHRPRHKNGLPDGPGKISIDGKARNGYPVSHVSLPSVAFQETMDAQKLRFLVDL